MYKNALNSSKSTILYLQSLLVCMKCALDNKYAQKIASKKWALHKICALA